MSDNNKQNQDSIEKGENEAPKDHSNKEEQKEVAYALN